MSYTLTPPEPVATPTPLPPTPTPVPPPTATPTPNPFAPQSGRSRIYVFNEIDEELTFTINNQEHKIPPHNLENPVAVDLDPGRYTYTVSTPRVSANGEVTMGADESWAVGMRGDYVVYGPSRVYPDQ